MSKVVDLALFLFFFCIFAIQVYDSLAKYYTADTLMSTKYENRREQKVIFPSVSICPGFKNVNWSREIKEYTQDVTPSVFVDHSLNLGKWYSHLMHNIKMIVNSKPLSLYIRILFRV